MNKMKNLKFFAGMSALFMLMLFLAFSPLRANAAEFFFEGVSTEKNLTKVEVQINTQDQEINSVSGKVVFSNPIAIQEISDGDSIVSLWVERPHISDNAVAFSGIIPGGYNASQGLLFSIFISSADAGQSSITAGVAEPQVLLNDGMGTQAGVSVQAFSYDVQATAVEPEEIFRTDQDKPEIFSPQIVRDEHVFDNKWFLVFATQDKNSGIDHYEVKEGFLSRFVNAESPFLLANQNMDARILVKAVDKNGNERIVSVGPLHNPPFYKKVGFYAILLVAIVLALWMSFRKGHEQQQI